MSSDSNLVPRGRDPFAQRQGSLTSGRIRKLTPLIGRKNRVYHTQISLLIKKPWAR